MNEILLGCLVVVLLSELICLAATFWLRYSLKKQINEEKELVSFHCKHLEEDLRIANLEIINIKSMIEKLAKDNSNILLAIITIKSMVDELAKHNSDISDVVDKAAKQYQEEISSLFGYCGENRSNE